MVVAEAPPVLPTVMVCAWLEPASPMWMVRTMLDPAPMFIVVVFWLPRLTVPAPLVCRFRVLVPFAETVKLPLDVDHVDPPPAVIVIAPPAVNEALPVEVEIGRAHV